MFKLERLLFAFAFTCSTQPLLAALPDGIPAQPTDPVTDQAGMLSDGTRERLNQVLRAVWDHGHGPQVAVLTRMSLDGRPIEDVALSVARGWGLGGEATDNGVLLLIARNDRQLRIEVGTKLEGDLTDIACQRIISGVMKPLLRQGEVDAAVSAGVAQILERVAPQSAAAADPEAGAQRSGQRRIGGLSIARIFLYLVIFIVYIWLRMKGWFGSRIWGSGRWGGGGWGWGGGFGGGGGGFGGGGGGFSGGGSSGSW